jgi:hypothetical protein
MATTGIPVLRSFLSNALKQSLWCDCSLHSRTLPTDPTITLEYPAPSATNYIKHQTLVGSYTTLFLKDYSRKRRFQINAVLTYAVD